MSDNKDTKKDTKKDTIGQVVEIELSSGHKFKGEFKHTRTIGKQKQVYLKLKGDVSRYFNVEDIKK